MKVNTLVNNMIAMAGIASLGLATIVSGCASIVNGNQQSVSVSTGATSGASCVLENNKGTWYIPSTPGSVVVHRSYENLNIECKKKGFTKTRKSVSSSTKAMAFGNIFVAPIIGSAVDVASGAAYDYPQEIHVPIERA